MLNREDMLESYDDSQLGDITPRTVKEEYRTSSEELAQWLKDWEDNKEPEPDYLDIERRVKETLEAAYKRQEELEKKAIKEAPVDVGLVVMNVCWILFYTFLCLPLVIVKALAGDK